MVSYKLPQTHNFQDRIAFHINGMGGWSTRKAISEIKNKKKFLHSIQIQGTEHKDRINIDLRKKKIIVSALHSLVKTRKVNIHSEIMDDSVIFCKGNRKVKLFW